MKGLKVREIPCSECFTNKDERLDTDFYLFVPKHNPNLRYKKIRDCLLYSQYGLSIAMNEDGIGYPIYRMNEIHNMLCDNEVLKYADISEDTFIPFALNDKDVLFNRTNSYEFVGRTSIYYLKNEPRTFASYLVRFVPNPDIIKPEYLTVFLNSKYGYSDIKRRARQSVNQTNVNPEEVKEIEIPLLPMDIQQEVASMLVLADKSLNHSDDLYSQAQELLQSALSISPYSPIIPTMAEKSLHESFIKTGRIDAEYYQPKYDFLFAELQKFECKKISDEYLGLRGDLIPDSLYSNDSSLRGYIRGADIAGNILTNDKMIYIDSSFNNETIYQSQTGDIILSLIGSVGCSAIVLPQFSGYYISNNLGALRPKYDSKILPEYLQVYLSSNVGKMLFERWSMRTAQPKISMSDILSFPIPILPMPVQQQIAALIRESFALRDEASKLLANARQLVEDTIENA